MKELITLHQANEVMYAAAAAAVVIGLFWGVVTRRIATGLIWGFGIGAGSLVMWKVYNAITDRLGLDTVKNLLVNLGLFIAVGLIAGIAIGLVSRRSGPPPAGAPEPVAVGGPTPRLPGERRRIEDSGEQPRQAG